MGSSPAGRGVPGRGGNSSLSNSADVWTREGRPGWDHSTSVWVLPIVLPALILPPACLTVVLDMQGQASLVLQRWEGRWASVSLSRSSSLAQVVSPVALPF